MKTAESMSCYNCLNNKVRIIDGAASHFCKIDGHKIDYISNVYQINLCNNWKKSKVYGK